MSQSAVGIYSDDPQTQSHVETSNQNEGTNVHEVIDKEELDPQTKVYEHSTNIKTIIEALGLSSYEAGSITVKDMTTIDPFKDETCVDLKQLPWILLRRLLCLNSDAMDLRCKQNQDRKVAKQAKRSIYAMFESTTERNGISPLDIFLLVFQCCDPMLKQLLFQKLFLCKMAVPFVYRKYSTLQSVVSIWPLRSLVINSENKGEKKELEILDMPTKIVTFARFGRPKFSKSQILNRILSDTVADTFFNRESPHGKCIRVATDGYIELSWLPTIGDTQSNFKDAITFINMRGDIRNSFQDTECEFTSAVTDVAVIVCDISAVLENYKYLKNSIVRFSAIILIIANPIKHDDLSVKKQFFDFKEYVLRENLIEMHMMCTHEQLEEKSTTEILTEVTDFVSELLENIQNKSLQERLDHVGNSLVQSDECATCNKARKNALSVIHMMEKEANKEKGLFHVTPAQSIQSFKLSGLLKQLHVEKDIIKSSNITQGINALRMEQTQKIKISMKMIIDHIKGFDKSSCFLSYFVKWLNYYLEQKKRKVLPDLMKQKQLAWDLYWKKKKDGKCAADDLCKLESTIKQLEVEIDSASFGIENIFREIHFICDAVLQLKIYTVISLADVHSLADAIACMVCNGLVFELLDGISFYMPTEWIKLVLNKIDNNIGHKKVLTVSVLGLQSSGKSTMLNTMFGVHFSTSSGRCTRGLHMQLIPMKMPKAVEQRPFDYVLVIDTEGLRAPELSTENYKRDNELATIITGLGDLTVLNVMGENMTELRDTLQILIHAFLRLKLAYERLDIEKSCYFIHQNVSETTASDKMKTGLQLSIKNLDTVTEESALSEGISNIKTFNQVIEFDTEKNVWYLPTLWQGNPPFARVNRKYSESVVGICQTLISRALRNTTKSYKSLNDIVVHTEDLWKGVLTEDFVFSFRNSLEKKAYIALETKFKEEMGNLENRIDDKFYDLSQKRFSQCDNKCGLNKAKYVVIKEIEKTVAIERASLTKCMNSFFGNNNFKDTTIQWKQHTMNQIWIFCEEIIDTKRQEIDSIFNRRVVDIMTNSMHTAHEEQLRQSTIEVANELKGQNMSKEEINKRFEDVWDMFVSDTLKEDKSGKYQSTLEHDFIDILTKMFSNHIVLLETLQKKPLHKTNPIILLSGSFKCTNISHKDISVNSVLQKVTDKARRMFNLKAAQSFTKAQNSLEMTFEDIDIMIHHLCTTHKEITNRDIKSFLIAVQSLVEQIVSSEDDFSLMITFKIKTMVFVSRLALERFDRNNREFNKVYGLEARLEKYKQHVKERFDAHLAGCKAEDTASKLFRLSLEDFLYEAVKDKLPSMVKQYLHDKLPRLKYHLITDILTDLVNKDQFTDWVHYIERPMQFADKWLTDKSEYLLFEANNGEYYKLAAREISNYMEDVNESIRESGKRLKNSSLTIHVWVDAFLSNLKTYKVPKECFRDVIRELESVDEIHLDHFTKLLKKDLKTSGNTVAEKFSWDKKESVKWTARNPYKEIFKDTWGCPGQCIFCGEPCMKSYIHDGSLHSCIQHRPGGCRGVYRKETLKISLTSCNFKVVSDLNAYCTVYNYLCNKPQRKPCSKEKHPYKQYRQFLPNWEIEPSNDMEYRSKFWMWYIAYYKEDLGKYYCMDVSDVPETWGDIKSTDAIESLRTNYRVEK